MCSSDLVAATRAQDKLIISGHLKETGTPTGYLKSIGLDFSLGLEAMGTEFESAPGISCVLFNGESLPDHHIEVPTPEVAGKSLEARLYKPLVVAPDPYVELDDQENSKEYEGRSWRSLGSDYAPAVVVGNLVHKAIQRWVFPSDENYDRLMQALLVKEGIVDEAQAKLVLAETDELLSRFTRSDLYKEILHAEQTLHETPYIIEFAHVESGVIDLLYFKDGHWILVDFKTDEIASKEQLDEVVRQYLPQVTRYQHAASKLLSSSVNARLCFLNYEESLKLVDVQNGSY